MVPDSGHGSHWGVIVAVVGYLALSVTGEAAEPENRAPVAERRQAVESQADRQPDDNQAPSQSVTWPETIGAAEDASKAECGTAEGCRSEQRDYSDLHAQWKAALAAEGQQSLATWQTILAAVGTGLLVWTLYETRKANQIARNAYTLDQRAWLSVHLELAGDWNADGRHTVPVSIVIANTGKTPALDIHISSETLPNMHAGDVVAAQRELADRSMATRDGDGFALFPGGQPHKEVIDVDPADYWNSGSAVDWSRRGFLDQDWYSPALIGCVTYTVTTDGERRQSSFIRYLQRVDPTTSRYVGLPVGSEKVSADDIQLHRWWAGDGRVT